MEIIIKATEKGHLSVEDNNILEKLRKTTYKFAWLPQDEFCYIFRAVNFWKTDFLLKYSNKEIALIPNNDYNARDLQFSDSLRLFLNEQSFEES